MADANSNTDADLYTTAYSDTTATPDAAIATGIGNARFHGARIGLCQVNQMRHD